MGAVSDKHEDAEIERQVAEFRELLGAGDLVEVAADKAVDDAVGPAGGPPPGPERRSGRDRRSGQKQWSGQERRSVPTRRSGQPRRPEQADSPGAAGDLAGALAGWADGPYAGVVIEMVQATRLDEPVLVAADVAERMVAPFAWMIRYVGERGVDLTSAGYLHPADVVAVAGALGVGREWIGALNREGYTLPVLTFRLACQSVRLLRLSKGRLNATRIATELADDPVALWWHIAGRLPLGGTDVERDAGVVILLDVASHGDPEWPPPHLRFGDADGIDDHLAAALHALGWAGSEGESLQSWQVRSLAEPTITVLERLGVYERDEVGIASRRPTPEGVAFARAVLRGRG